MANGKQRREGEESPWSARAIARRNVEAARRPLSPVMKTAATACELAHREGREPSDGEGR